jgi:hypothetical protein
MLTDTAGDKNCQIETPAPRAITISRVRFNLVKHKIEPNKNAKGITCKVKFGSLKSAMLIMIENGTSLLALLRKISIKSIKNISPTQTPSPMNNHSKNWRAK